MNDEQIDRILVALSREGFSLPHMARSCDYVTPEELRAADDEAGQRNREALRSALAEAGDDCSCGVSEPGPWHLTTCPCYRPTTASPR